MDAIKVNELEGLSACPSPVLTDVDGSRSVISTVTASMPNKVEAAALARIKQQHLKAARFDDVLKNNKSLLKRNLILSAEFFGFLREHKLMPETMILHVQEKKDREEQNALLVDLLIKLGPNIFWKLCDILDLTGHHFLADHLRHQGSTELKDLAPAFRTIMEKFPKLSRVLSPTEQRHLVCMLKDKFNELLVGQSWTQATSERVRLVDERNKVLEDDVHKDRKIRELMKQTETLNEEIQLNRQEIENNLSDINNLHYEMEKLNEKHETEMNKLIAANDASERSNALSLSRVEMFDGQIKSINVRILKHFGESEYNARSNADNVRVSLLEQNVNMVFTQLYSLQQELASLREEREKERKELFHAMRIQDRNQPIKIAYYQSMSSVEDIIKLFMTDVNRISVALNMTNTQSALGLDEPEKQNRLGIHMNVMGGESGIGDELEQRMTRMRDGFTLIRVALEKVSTYIAFLRGDLKERESDITKLKFQIKALRMNQKRLADFAKVQNRVIGGSPSDKQGKISPLLPPVSRESSSMNDNNDGFTFSDLHGDKSSTETSSSTRRTLSPATRLNTDSRTATPKLEKNPAVPVVPSLTLTDTTKNVYPGPQPLGKPSPQHTRKTTDSPKKEMVPISRTQSRKPFPKLG